MAHSYIAMKENNNSKIWSLIITLLLTVATLLFLLYYNLDVQYPPKGMEKLAELDQDSIYVETLDDEPLVPLGGASELESGENVDNSMTEPENGPAAADQGPDQPAEPQAEGTDREDAGKPSPVQPKPITSAAPSPMKVKEKPKTETRVKPGAAKKNAKPTSPTRVKAATQSKTAGTAKTSSQANAIGNRMRNAFGRGGSNAGSGTGKTAASGAGGTAARGHSLGSGLEGYTVAYWGRPHSRYEGTVVVRVHVSARGQVTSATIAGGTITDAAARQSCISESLKCRFSVPKNRTSEGIGTIIWRFV